MMLRQRQAITFAVMPAFVCATAMLGGCMYTGCCGWDEGGIGSSSGFPLYRPYLTLGEYVRNQPISSFVVERFDASQVADLSDMTSEELAATVEPLPKQVIGDANIQDIQTGYMKQLGVDSLGRGFAITTNFANGASNQQTFVPTAEGERDWNIDLLRYSFRRGAWSGISLDPIDDEVEPDRLVDGRRAVRFLPPGLKLDPPPPNQVIIMVNPVTVNESGDVERMGVSPRTEIATPSAVAQPRTDIATPGGDAQPRTDIATPGVDSPRTDIITPGSGVGVIGRERRGVRNELWGDYFQINVGAGFAGVNVPETGTGTRITNQGDEIFLVNAPRFLTGVTLDAGFTIPIGGVFGGDDDQASGSDVNGESWGGLRDPRLYFNFNYLDVSGDESVRVEPNTDNTAFTLPNLMSPSNFTGTGFGLLGAEGTMDVDYERWDVELGGGFDMYVCGCRCTELTFEPHFNITGSDLTYDGSVRIVSLPDNIARVRQDIETNTYGLGFRTTVDHKLCKRLSIFASADIGGYYYDADAQSHTMQDFPALAPPDDMFEINQSGSTDGIGFRGGLEVGLKYRFNRNAAINVFTGFTYESDQAFWMNPANPAQPQAHVATDDLWTAYAGLGFMYRF